MSNPSQVDSSMWEKGLKADDCVDCGKIFYSKGRSSRCLSCYNKIQTSSEKLIYQCPRCTKHMVSQKTYALFSTRKEKSVSLSWRFSLKLHLHSFLSKYSGRTAANLVTQRPDYCKTWKWDENT